MKDRREIVMKKIFSITVMLLMVTVILLLAACGGSGKTDLSDSKYVGTWKAEKMALKDESEELSGEWILTLNGDGTGKSVSEGETTSITWELTDGGFRTKGDTKLKFKDDGDNIKTKILGVDLVFKKQK
jgi:predicted small lipoprotein YifL